MKLRILDAGSVSKEPNAKDKEVKGVSRRGVLTAATFAAVLLACASPTSESANSGAEVKNLQTKLGFKDGVILSQFAEGASKSTLAITNGLQFLADEPLGNSQFGRYSTIITRTMTSLTTPPNEISNVIGKTVKTDSPSQPDTVIKVVRSVAFSNIRSAVAFDKNLRTLDDRDNVLTAYMFAQHLPIGLDTDIVALHGNPLLNPVLATFDSLFQYASLGGEKLNETGDVTQASSIADLVYGNNIKNLSDMLETDKKLPLRQQARLNLDKLIDISTGKIPTPFH